MNQYEKNTWAMSAMDAKQKAEWLERCERLSIKDDEAVRGKAEVTSDAGAKQSWYSRLTAWVERNAWFVQRTDRGTLVSWWAIACVAIGLLLSLLLLELKAQDKYSAARKRLSVPEIVLPDISILKPSHILSTLADDAGEKLLMTVHIKNTIAAIDSELTEMSVAKDTVGTVELRETRDWFQSLIVPPHHWHGDTLIH